MALQDCIGGIKRYVEHGIPPGGFLTAVLSNDLREAFARADQSNIADMFVIVSYCYNEIPGNCWGSPERMQAWYKRFTEPTESED